MVAMAFLTSMTVPISRVSKVWGRNLSREIFSNIGQHSLHLGFEAPVQDHVVQPDHHARHDLRIDGFVDADRPAHARGKDRAQPFLLRLGERKRNDDFDFISINLWSWPVGLPDVIVLPGRRCPKLLLRLLASPLQLLLPLTIFLIEPL